MGYLGGQNTSQASMSGRLGVLGGAGQPPKIDTTGAAQRGLQGMQGAAQTLGQQTKASKSVHQAGEAAKTAGGALLSSASMGATGATVGSAVAGGAQAGSTGGWIGAGIGAVVGLAAYYLM